ncbi:uncharacterized protein LOC132266261 [Cornus florida]|uniref:uncharacterized protein LOC132266261 n=1 Tax=Cornus florida TaxID=4283 RepID=UPI00289F274E|nr:uncharacterized protein LOC132266261 [Cornus florida]
MDALDVAGKDTVGEDEQIKSTGAKRRLPTRGNRLQESWRRLHMNNREIDKLILARLDRVLATSHWSQLFPRCMVHHLIVQGSDHNALLLCLNDSLSHFRRNFLFNARWVKEDEFKPLVALLRLKESVDGFDKHVCFRATEILKNFTEKAKVRRRKNEIFRLEDFMGQWRDSKGDIRRVAEDYFQDLFVVVPDLAISSFGEVLKGDLLQEFNDFVNGRPMPHSLNSTNLVIILKVPHPTSISNFCHFALCNVSYKILVFANRLKLLLPLLISETQSVFVPNHLIHDNIILAHDILHVLKSKMNGDLCFMALKLNLAKAYDRVSWAFMGKFLRHSGLSLLFNASDRLSQRLGLKAGRGCPLISHLLFADDALILYFPPNTSSSQKVTRKLLLGIHTVDWHNTYLGLPSFLGHSKMVALNFLSKKLSAKASLLKGSMMSRVGREVLLVLSTIPDTGGLGFHDVEAFNIAFLAKITKQMEVGDNSMLLKTFKPKYFKNCNFVELLAQPMLLGFRKVVASKQRGLNFSLVADLLLPSLQGWNVKMVFKEITRQNNLFLLPVPPVQFPLARWVVSNSILMRLLIRVVIFVVEERFSRTILDGLSNLNAVVEGDCKPVTQLQVSVEG